MKKILFIGGGNMAKAIVAGLVKNGYNPQNISVIDRNLDKCQDLSEKYDVLSFTHYSSEIISSSDIIILAVKPQGASQACASIKSFLYDHSFPILVSVMAGITTKTLAAWLRDDLAIIRAMPNTPSLVQSGATGLFCNTLTSLENREFINSIFNSIGKIAWLKKEDDINSITALSGSGPAYIFLIMEYMQREAINMGLDPAVSKDFTLQTVLGAATLALLQDVPFDSLREKVTSKGGTTYAAITTMQENNLDKIFVRAMAACKNRALELSNLFSSENEPKFESKIKV